MAIITPPPQTEDFSVLPDEQFIFVFDDLLPNWLVKWGDEQMQGFNWKYGQAAYPGGQRFFGQVLKDENIHRELPWPAIVEIILKAFLATKLKTYLTDAAQYVETKKILVNGQLPSTPGNAHKDSSFSNMWTLVYHCSDTDGSNVFYVDDTANELVKRVDFKQGRCVLFPSWYSHVGNAPSAGWRISIAFHMVIESPMNQKRFLNASLPR